MGALGSSKYIHVSKREQMITSTMHYVFTKKNIANHQAINVSWKQIGNNFFAFIFQLYSVFLALFCQQKVALITLILWQNMEIKRAMSTFSKKFPKQFHFSLTFPWLWQFSWISRFVATMLQYSHSTICLWPDFLVHPDQPTTVVHKDAILTSAFYVHPKYEIQCFRVL